MKCLIAVILFAGLAACQHRGTAPTPPSAVTAARASLGITAALDAARKTVVGLRSAGTITEAETVAVQNCIIAGYQADKSMNKVLRAAGTTLTTQDKAAIAAVWASAALQQTASKVSPQAATVLTGITTAVNTVLASLGVPTV